MTIREVFMNTLTVPQTTWLNMILLRYFPNISSFYNLSSAFGEIFGECLRFAREQTLTLPRHLRFPGEMELDVPASEEMELDVPKMLDNEPFLHLIDNRYLAEIKEKAAKEIFNIFYYMARKEEERFYEGFKKKHKSSGTYDEVVPDLFFLKLGNPRSRVLGKYEAEKKGKVIKKYFRWDFSRMLGHNPVYFYNAYRQYAHKVYNLRSFGLLEEKTEKDYKTLEKSFKEYLMGKIRFYKRLIDKARMIDVSNGSELTDEENKTIDFCNQYDRIINEALESEIGEDRVINSNGGKRLKNRDYIYAPSDVAALIYTIRMRGNKKWLSMQVAKNELPVIPGNINSMMRDRFRKILNCPSSAFEFLSLESQELLDRASQNDVFDKIKAMYRLAYDPNNKGFLKHPYIANIFTPEFRQDLLTYRSPKPISIFKTTGNSEDSGTMIVNKEVESITGYYNSMDISDQIAVHEFVKKMKEEVITQFQNYSANFVNKLIDNFRNEMIRLFHYPNSVIFDILNKAVNDYGIGRLFRETQSEDTEDEFSDKMVKVIAKYKELVKEYFL